LPERFEVRFFATCDPCGFVTVKGAAERDRQLDPVEPTRREVVSARRRCDEGALGTLAWGRHRLSLVNEDGAEVDRVAV